MAEQPVLRKMWLYINGVDRVFVCNPDKDTLCDVIRKIGLTGTKLGCGVGQCGACNVILDGKLVRACVRKMKTVKDWSTVTTIEGIGTPTNLHPLQQAWITYGGVQCGFCSPGFIVSSYALLQENPKPTREEVRDWFTKNRNACRCTGWKPLVDCVMAAAAVMRGEKTMADITFKTPGDGRIYNTAVPRPAALSKVTGTCDFGDDIGLKMPEGTAHLAVVQGKCNHANIKGIDYSEAEKMPGVIKVVTAKDIKGNNRIMIPLAHPRAKADGFERPILNDKKLFRYGDVVAIVAAETREQAREAAKKVKLDLEVLPAYMTYLDAVAPGAMEIHPGFPNEYLRCPVVKGPDTREVIEKSKYVAEASLYGCNQPHMVMEPECGQAYYDEDGNLCLQTKTLALIFPILCLPPGLGIPEGKIRAIENPTGASFGSTLSPGVNALLGAACMALGGRPVTLTMSWDEHNWYDGKRAAHFANVRAAADDKGKMTALEYDLVYDHGCYTEMADCLAPVALQFCGYGYNIPSLKGLARAGFSNSTYGTAYRSYGNCQAFSIIEPVIDMLAYECGMDPFDFRYQNLAVEGDLNPTSMPYKQYPFKKLMDMMRPHYFEAKERARKESTPEKLRGVGFATGGYRITGGPGDHSEVAIGLNPDGTITHYNTWEDQGQGADVGTLVLTHEALKPLGIKWQDIKLVMADTGQGPMTGPAGANRCHYMAGNATIDAANKLMDAMRKPDGTFRTYDEMVAENIPTKYTGVHDTTHLTTGLDPNTGVGDPVPQYSYMFFMAEVEVDAKTGATKCLSMRMAYDIGVVGSVQAVEGQGLGAMTHSLGYALKDDYLDDKDHNSLVKCGFMYANEVPDNLELMRYEGPRAEDAPFGSVGCCEGFQSAGHVAVTNAIYAASGVRITELPASPAKVLAGLKAKAEGKEFKTAKYFLGSDFHDTMEDIAANPVEYKAPDIVL